MVRSITIAVVIAFIVVAPPTRAQEPPSASLPPFDVWLAQLRVEALTRGIRPEIVDAAFSDVQQPVAQILERDRTQAEFSLDLTAYLRRRLTKNTLRTAQEMYTQYRDLLESVGKKYGVQPKIITAVWGLESNFGRFAGVRPTIPALATLAYDPRRAPLFRNELFSALEILNRGDIELDRLKGSWAGALGQPQFMPSTYLQYSQDFDGDGRRDIWASQADVFASVAYYLQEHGWTDKMTWGREVKVPKASFAQVKTVPQRAEGCRAERALTTPRSLKDWRKMGLRTMGGAPIPTGTTDASPMARATSSSTATTKRCSPTTAPPVMQSALGCLQIDSGKC
jgi:peptidoglycan lytic transglycosylase B